MMKYFILLTTAFLASQSVFADERYICTLGQAERVVSLVYDDAENFLPCEVRYTKEGKTETLWQSSKTVGYCENKIKEFVKQQTDSGWHCDNASSHDSIVDTVSKPAVDKNLLAFYFSNAIVAASTFKVAIVEHYMMFDAYPKDFQAMGINPETMKNGPYFSDLVLGELGSLYITGIKEAGIHSIIRLEPISTKEGISLEWQCTTNVKLSMNHYCAYKNDLTI